MSQRRDSTSRHRPPAPTPESTHGLVPDSGWIIICLFLYELNCYLSHHKQQILSKQRASHCNLWHLRGQGQEGSENWDRCPVSVHWRDRFFSREAYSEVKSMSPEPLGGGKGGGASCRRHQQSFQHRGPHLPPHLGSLVQKHILVLNRGGGYTAL